MRTHRPDAGFSLAALIFFATAASILIAVAVPAYQMQAKREMEAELIFRGEEYVRAIQKYQRKFTVSPTSVDQLLSTNNLRFLRRAYKDPVTGKDFRLITVNPDGSVTGSKLFQQNMNNQSLFGNTQAFGQGQNSQQQLQQAQQGLQQGQQRGFQATGQQGFGQQQQGFGQQQQGFGQQQQGFGGPGGVGFPNRGAGGQQFSTQGQPQRGQVGGANPGLTGAGGAPIAAGGIIGVASDSDKASIKVYNNRQKYDEWEFIAIPGQQGQQGQRGPQQNPQQQNPNQQQNPFGQRQTNPFPNTPTNPLGGTPTTSPFGPAGGGQRQIQSPFGFGGTPQPQSPQPGKLP